MLTKVRLAVKFFGILFCKDKFSVALPDFKIWNSINVFIGAGSQHYCKDCSFGVQRDFKERESSSIRFNNETWRISQIKIPNVKINDFIYKI